MVDEKKIFTMQIKFPSEIRHWLKKKGRENFHSMHSEVLTILREAKNREERAV